MATLQQLDTITPDPEGPSPTAEANGRTNDTAAVQGQAAEGQHAVTTGGNLVSSTPLGPKTTKAVLVLGIITSICGILLTSLGVAISGYINFKSDRSCPALWWAGLPPLVMGIFGIVVSVRWTRKHLLYWAILSVVIAVTAAAIMVVAGNFSPGRYNVWPPISKHKGQDLCKTIEETCFCQNIYQGPLSQRKVFGIRYFHEDLWWKDTGFTHCEDVYTISKLYFSAMACVALYLLLSLVSVSIGFAGSVCAEPETEVFRRLEEEPEGGSGVSSA